MVIERVDNWGDYPMYRARFADGVVYGVSHIQALLNALGAIQGQHDAEVNGL